MSKALLILFAVCVLPAIASARFVRSPFRVVGPVYCDTCRCGYETEATKYLAGATVSVECRSRKTGEVTYTKSGVTDATGNYQILVDTDRGDDFCDVVLVKSSDPQCAEANAGRDRSRVILTRNNGMISDTRVANAMGFLSNTPLASCTEILKKYQETEDEV